MRAGALTVLLTDVHSLTSKEGGTIFAFLIKSSEVLEQDRGLIHAA